MEILSEKNGKKSTTDEVLEWLAVESNSDMELCLLFIVSLTSACHVFGSEYFFTIIRSELYEFL